MRQQNSSGAQDPLVHLPFVRLNPCVSRYAKAQASQGGKALLVNPGGSALIRRDNLLDANPKERFFPSVFVVV